MPNLSSITPSTVQHTWHTAVCTRRHQETADTFTYEFLPEQAFMASFAAGAHLNVRITTPEQTHIRTYTLSSSPKKLPLFSLTIKQVSDGIVSNWLAEHMVPGRSLEFTVPDGDFVLPEHPPGRLLFIGAGSGITPMMSMLRFLAESANRSEIEMLYYARTPDDIIFRDELLNLADRIPGLRLNFCVENATADWAGLTGRVQADHFSQLSQLNRHEVYLCGPAGFMQAATGFLKQQGVAEYQIHREVFALDLGAVSVTSDAKVQFTSEADASPAKRKTLLEEAESRGLEITSGCRSGICKTCRCMKLSGETVNLLTGERSQTDNEYILPCVTQAVTDTLIAL
ncbi:MAG: iron-sulfur cluster-binding domain-containing protein [Hahellaceae bacterium]|nr:iron-sulfur cluster-binding domain-containing protein [Hahellaceae bacterium]